MGPAVDPEALAEADAIAALQGGDIPGLETLVSRYLASARRVAASITLDHDAGQDAAQSAFMRAADAIGRFDRTRPFWPWFRRIVVNEALRSVRARRRIAEGVELDSLPGSESCDPPRHAQAREVRQLLDRALNDLDRRDRSVLVLRYFEDRSIEVMALELGWPVGTVKARLSRARRRLRLRIERGPPALLDGLRAETDLLCGPHTAFGSYNQSTARPSSAPAGENGYVAY